MTTHVFLRTITATALTTVLAHTATAMAQKTSAPVQVPEELGNDMLAPLVNEPKTATDKKTSSKKTSSESKSEQPQYNYDDILQPLTLPKEDWRDAGMKGSVTPPAEAQEPPVYRYDDILQPLILPDEDWRDAGMKGSYTAEEIKRIAAEKLKKQRQDAKKRDAEEKRQYEIDVAEYERQLAEAERERERRNREEEKTKKPRKTIIVERKYMDQCGDFIVKWSGEKICQPRLRTKWEAVTENGDDKPEDKAPRQDTADNRHNGPPPVGRDGPSGSPPPFGRDGPSGSPPPTGRNGPSGSPPPVGRDGSFGGDGAGAGAGGTGASSGSGAHVVGNATSVPDARGFRAIGPYTVRIDGTKRHANGDVDVDVTFATPTNTRLLIGNGDWRLLATDEDGVSTDTIAIYREGTGPLVAFDRMPYVSVTAPAKARFRVLAVAGMSTIRSVTIIFSGLSGITVPVDPMGSSTGDAAPESAAAGGRLKWFEVRYDALKTVGQTTELTFTARNVTDTLQYAGGTRLQFVATGANGKAIDNTGLVYAARGPRGRQFDGVSVVPGQAARFRVVFDAPDVRGPITVKDGATTATPPVPAAPAAAEPVW